MQKADLASVLDLPGPITVFAPDSLAFDSMSEGHLQYLDSPEVRTTQRFSAASVGASKSPGDTFILRVTGNWWSCSGTTWSSLLRSVRFTSSCLNPSQPSALLILFLLLALKVDVCNLVSSHRIVTMANQVLTVNVTGNVSVVPNCLSPHVLQEHLCRALQR